MPAALAPSRARGEGCWHCSSPCGAWVPAPSPGTRAGEGAASPCPITTRLSGPFRPAWGVGQRESRQPFSYQGAAFAGSRSEATEVSCPLQPVEELVRKRQSLAKARQLSAGAARATGVTAPPQGHGPTLVLLAGQTRRAEAGRSPGAQDQLWVLPASSGSVRAGGGWPGRRSSGCWADSLASRDLLSPQIMLLFREAAVPFG